MQFGSAQIVDHNWIGLCSSHYKMSIRKVEAFATLSNAQPLLCPYNMVCDYW